MSAGPPSLRIESRAVAFSRGERFRRASRRLGPLLFVLAAAAGAVTEATHHYVATGNVLLGTFALSLVGGLVYTFSGAWRGRAAPGSIEVAEGRITIRCGASLRHLGVAELEHGWSAPPDGVGLRMADGSEFRAECTPAEAEALLDLVGLGPAQCVARAPIASAASWQRGGVPLATLALLVCSMLAALSTLACLVGSFMGIASPRLLLSGRSLLIFGAWALLSLIFNALSIVLGRYLRPRELVIGTDGVALGKRFYAHRDIASVVPFGWGVHLVLHDGSVVPLPVRGRGRAALPTGAAERVTEHAIDHEIREAILARIADARSVRTGSPTSRPIEALERRASPLAAWRERLRNLLEREPTYRAPAVHGGELRRLVADPAATPEQRIAATVALSASAAPSDRRKLRIAVGTCADADLRAALEHAAAGEIDERRLARVLVVRRLRCGQA
jgi:hypothetical protein